MPPAIRLALFSGALTFLAWFAVTVVVFAVVGYACGRRFRRLVPDGQDHMPPHLLFWTPLLGSVVIGALAGLHMAVPVASLAAGDAVYTQGMVIRLPWTPPPPDLITPVPLGWDQGLAELRRGMHPRRLVVSIGGKLVLGAFWGPLRAGHIVFRAWQADGEARPGVETVDRAAGSWRLARPDLDRLARAGVIASLGLGILEVFLLALLALVVAWLARRDLRPPPVRVVAVPPPPLS